MYLYLIRHAETEENKAGIIQGHTSGSLTPRGRNQAKSLALYISSFGLDVVYSSDLQSAQDTAIIMMEEETNAIPIHYDPRLRGRDTGEWTGRHGSDLCSDRSTGGCPDEWLHLLDTYDTVESLVHIAQRAHDFLYDLENHHADDSVGIVTHRWWIHALLLAAQIDQPLSTIHNTSRCLCSRKQGELRLLSPCATPHLEVMGGL